MVVAPVENDSAADERQVVVQFRDTEGQLLGNQYHLPLGTTRNQLQSLLNQIKEEESYEQYAFHISGPTGEKAEITTSLAQAVSSIALLTTERLLDIKVHPLAPFKVHPVTRCTSSLEGHSEAVLCLSFSPDGTLLASGSGDTTVRIWDLTTETPIRTLKGHSNWVLTVVWSPSGRLLASAGMDKSVRLWDVTNSTGKGDKVLSGHSKGVSCLAWQPLWTVSKAQTSEHPYLASSGLDFQIRIWDAIRGVILTILSGHTLPVTHIAFSSSSNLSLFSSSKDTTIKVWNVSKGTLLHELKGHAHWVNFLTVNTDLQMLTLKALQGELPSQSHSRSLVEETPSKALEVFSTFFKKSCGGRELLVSASDDCTMILWDSQSAKLIARLTGHQRPVNHVRFSVDSRFIASASFDKSIRLWDASSGKYLAVLRGHVGPVYRLAWSADSRSLVTASSDSTVKVWDFHSKKLKEDLPGHADEVYAVDWSADGARVATGSKDRLVKIWRH